MRRVVGMRRLQASRDSAKKQRCHNAVLLDLCQYMRDMLLGHAQALGDLNLSQAMHVVEPSHLRHQAQRVAPLRAVHQPTAANHRQPANHPHHHLGMRGERSYYKDHTP